jgi:(4S)-4-hydroxy-5-phosphonooxypentane-2,3-dione isomerase
MEESHPMLIVQVEIHVLAEHLEAFRQATLENAGNSRQEPGIARFDFLQHSDDPTRFQLMEVYRDADAPAKHRETAHYLAWAEKVTPMLVEPRTRQWYTNIDPGDEDF